MKSCPVDGKALREVMAGELSVDVCDTCGGKWFDDGELTAFAKQGAQAVAQFDVDYPNTTGQMPPPGDKQCPSCSSNLFGFSFKHTPDLVMEGCRECKGIWLDQGKLTQLAVKLGLPPDQLPQPAAPVVDEEPWEIPCPECGATNKPDDRECWQCQASLVPDAPACPRCLEELADAERDGVELQACASCGGVWIDETSLRELFAYHMDTCGALDSGSQRREEDMQPRVDAATCPTCKTGMLEHEFIAQLESMYNVPTGIHADRCTTCNGMWFDVGELTAVQQAVVDYKASKADEPQSVAFGYDDGDGE